MKFAAPPTLSGAAHAHQVGVGFVVDSYHVVPKPVLTIAMS
ncbi:MULTISPECIES: hypothetical protein [Nocardia]|nr:MULTISPECIES: hypothetical protein [Nocardia]